MAEENSTVKLGIYLGTKIHEGWTYSFRNTEELNKISSAYYKTLFVTEHLIGYSILASKLFFNESANLGIEDATTLDVIARDVGYITNKVTKDKRRSPGLVGTGKDLVDNLKNIKKLRNQ
ncbi:hypothetical protein CL617_03085 [archaeon]|nr:hypothetical protein [archaeon]|tara:strand:+ start:23397 stop:23756 length:360 start_codon:yes stop_codon:yes gene_type:complete